LATLRGGAEAVSALVADPDPLARTAALAAVGELGCGQDDFAIVERAAGAVADLAVSLLSEALADARAYARRALERDW
jgi:hypothetical protein